MADPRCSGPPSPPGEERDAFRCICGSLLARRVPEGVELKCRRCKRTLVIPLRWDDGEPAD